MDIEEKTIWQQAAGDTNRSYAGLFLRWDVILNGPGYSGHWADGGEEKLREDKWSTKKLSDLRRFAEQMAPGDLVVLRLGTTDVLGVGEIVGDYEWLDIFGDVDGWDLQHVRRVRWLWKAQEGQPERFPLYSLKLGDTTQPLNPGLVLDWLKDLAIPNDRYSKSIASLPSDNNQKIDIDTLSEFLFNKGVASASIATLANVIGELTRIAKWYQNQERSSVAEGESEAERRPEAKPPSEAETIAYLVVPLLRALGWTPQKMAVEWNRVDLALFRSLPRHDDSLSVVVEAKRKGNSCLTAVPQAQVYAGTLPACSRLIVTDGLRFGVYVRSNNTEHQFKLHAYMNLTRLKHNYPIYGCFGANEAILAMTPEWQPTDPR